MGAFAKGAPIRVIGSVATGHRDLFWYAKASSPLRSLNDATSKTTVGYSTTGSATNIILLKLLRSIGSAASLVRAGDVTSNLTMVRSGQLDIGFASPPAGLDLLQSGDIKVIARGSDVTSMQDESVRTIAAHQQVASRRDLTSRFLRSYNQALDWMYSSSEALTAYARYSGVSVDLTRIATAEFYPKDMLDPYRVTGVTDG
jgi:NitT/TauT family transport system substrate-binding protein